MQWSKTLALLQLCATGVLIWKVWTLEPTPSFGESHAAKASASSHLPSGPPRTGYDEHAVSARSVSSNDSVEAAEIRRIIREELAALDRRSVAGQSRAAPEPHYDEAFQQRLEQVSARLETVLSAGRIGNAEMEHLHAEIGSLHPKDRRLLLSRLAKAINAGAVKVTL